jgi:peptidoglycan hydrolase-like protein with peptidoglycan-binding domain
MVGALELQHAAFDEELEGDFELRIDAKFLAAAVTRIAILALAFLLGSIPSFAASRVAFLVGNSAYEYASALSNPVRDVALIGKTLEGLGFEVSLHNDLTRDGIGRELSSFLKQHDGADVTLFYFAGHGMQFEGQNYLVGVDAKLETEFDISSEALDLERVVGMLERSSRASLVFVDACRDNPLADRFYKENYSETRALMTRGLAPIKTAHSGSMLTFSASPGQVAYDGDEYSPFARALATHLPAENVEVLSLMKRVIRDVKVATTDKQTPLVTNDLTQEIYLKLSADGAGNKVALAQEEAMFEAALAIGGMRAWDLYFKRYPDGFFKELALAERERLQVTQLAAASGIDTDNLDTSKPVAITREVARQVEQSLGLTKEDAMLVQEALNSRGYNAGVVDGDIGTGTRKAIADFQAAVQLPSTGVVTKATADALGIMLGKAETSDVALVSTQNARRYDPQQLALIEDDKRLIKAAEALKSYEYTYGFFEGRLYIGVLSWGISKLADANDFARRAGGYLATMTSSAENTFVVDLVSHDDRFWRLNAENRGTVGPGFGLFQLENAREPDGGWSWITGEPLGYVNWMVAAPGNWVNVAGVGVFHKYYQRPLDKAHPVDTWSDWPNYDHALVLEFD